MSEASKLTWDRVDLEKGTWHLPDLKNGNKVWLPLSSQAVEVLRSRQNLGINSPYVFSLMGWAYQRPARRHEELECSRGAQAHAS